MKLLTSPIVKFLALSIELAFAVPLEQVHGLYPSSIECGPGQATLFEGLPNIGRPDWDDLRKAAQRLAKKGGTCTTPAGSGKCVRVACDNTTGIYMCNNNGHNGPYSAKCTEVAAFVYRGEPDGRQTNDLWMTCRHVGLYDVHTVSGQAFDARGDWKIVTGYANCKHSPLNQPDAE